MLNVSRTSVSESWLAGALPLKSHKTHKSLDAQAAVTRIGQNRFSISTINSDLFPELLSWSAMMNEQPTSPRSQNIPSDVSKREPEDVDLEVTYSISLVFDPTSLDFGFDSSCLEGLDDRLIYSPLEAYQASCWSELSHSHSSDRSLSPTISTPFPYPSHPRRSEESKFRRQTRSPLVTSDSSDESDSDSDSCMTYKEDDMHTAVISDVPLLANRQCATGLYNDEKDAYYDDDTTSFILFEPSYSIPKPQESVGFFPIPSRIPRPSMPSRIVAFCANRRQV